MSTYLKKIVHLTVAMVAAHIYEARLVFGDLGVHIVNGHRLLGGVMGDCMTVDNFVKKKAAIG